VSQSGSLAGIMQPQQIGNNTDQIFQMILTLFA